MSFSAECLRYRGTHLLARSNADLARGTVRVAGIHRDHANPSAASFQMAAAYGQWGCLYAITREHGRSAGRRVSNSDGKV
jgi:hypothetical protein